MSPAHVSRESGRAAFVFSVTSIGDLVLATLTFDIIARRTGGLLTVVGAGSAPPLLAADGRVAAVHAVRPAPALAWRLATLRQLAAARALRAQAVNFEVYPPRWRFVQRWARVLGLDALTLDLPEYRADNARSARGEPTTLPHRAHHYLRALGEPGEPPPARLLVPAAAAAEAERRLRDAARAAGLDPGLLERPRVVLHVGCTEPARRAPQHLLAALAENFTAGRAALPILVGDAAERGDAAHVRAGLAHGRPVLDLCGGLHLGELAALTRSARLFVGGDSGPLKIAEAVGTRTLSFWAVGATRPAFAGPRGPGHTVLTFAAGPERAVKAAFALLEGSSVL